MSTFQEFDKPQGPRTNYKKWSFKVLIYTIAFNALVIFMMYRGNYMPIAIVACQWLANILLLVSTILIILSIQHKEPKNYEYYVSIVGNAILIILTILSIIILFNT